MVYKAKKVYQDKDVVSKYDIKRFGNLKGFLTNRMELRLIWRALSFAGIVPPAIILDMPCGTGRLAIYLAQKGFTVKAVDISPQMVSYTKEKVVFFNLTDKIVVEQGDAESLPYPNNSFDVCVSLRLFGHTPSKIRKKILLELKRVTKRCLILTYYHKNCLQRFLRKRHRERKQIEWHPLSYKQIEEELEAVSFKKIKCFPLLVGISETVVILVKKA